MGAGGAKNEALGVSFRPGRGQRGPDEALLSASSGRPAGSPLLAVELLVEKEDEEVDIDLGSVE